MSLEFYSLINFFAMIITILGLVLPAIIIYFYSSYKTHLALIASAAALLLSMLVVGEYVVVLMPFILPIIFAGFMGTILRKYSQEFWQSMGYMILAEMTGIIIGIIAIYFYFGMQDIAGLLGESFRAVYQSSSANNEIASLSLNTMTQILMLAKQGGIPDFDAISAMSVSEKLDIIVPMIKAGMAQALPSFIMGYGIISGVWAWFMSSVMIRKRQKNKKPLPGIEKYVAHPVFSEWKLPRWLTNVLMFLLLASIIISFATTGPLLNVASALQTVALVIMAIQGLAVVNWWLKKKKVHIAVNVTICAFVAVFLGFILPWAGIFDIMFSFRMSDAQREAIKKKMEDIKKQVDEQMSEMKEQKKEEENKEDTQIEDKEDEEKDSEQDESEGEK